MKKRTYEIESVVAMLMHNGRLADPANEWAKKMKIITGKRKKTDDDLLELRRLEWHGGIYVNAEGEPIIPGEVLESALVASAKSERKGQQFKCGVWVPEDAILAYDGPRDIERLYEMSQFVDCRPARVGQSRVMRTRPRFDNWATSVTVHFDPRQVDSRTLDAAFNNLGQSVGVCDNRPRYGRFVVTKVSGDE